MKNPKETSYLQWNPPPSAPPLIKGTTEIYRDMFNNCFLATLALVMSVPLSLLSTHGTESPAFGTPFNKGGYGDLSYLKHQELSLHPEDTPQHVANLAKGSIGFHCL